VSSYTAKGTLVHKWTRLGWLKTLQKSTIENHNLATVAAFILALKTVIETNDGEGDHKAQQTLSMVTEE